mmetsp:Transcript_7777/g.11122  ORF Transcript_7777/g.11122 Transcript_7777/m.11122 type:complete len:1174 (+) Transcript_7777:54-3575(+)|eukprot:CAMPEP_0184873862 /NCGR_PEP_ID=MMETSP0580-20130426/42069_1 /TAXON_ID=1118495 /ORGANISM="Dactyliosolen fragilissimus" /LENGTH=1173 /DNA_ID=CAMNT_0027376803 /DNA_START=52 /DNA_END=3573 /DNA_ORIENTATION=+
MADDLDALFGAFDGDGSDGEGSAGESDTEKESLKTKKAKSSEGEHNLNGEDDDDSETESSSGKEKIVDESDNHHHNGQSEISSTDEKTDKKEDNSHSLTKKNIHAISIPTITSKIGETTGNNNFTSSNNEDKNNRSSSRNNSKDEDTTTSVVTTEEQEERKIATGTSHDKSIRGYSAIPENYEPPPISEKDLKKPPAKTYPFPLDPFQATAISYVRKNESVLVAAHTSAGKTVVAEYAIAQSLREGQRVIYTSPIKALSNQKYRDLQEEFEDVGLMTGDITINPTATCLVMTTEILRSMLYRGSELMREVAWVIYDEVHYMRDESRGVVWEESIVLLPHRVRFVFLSATIPNASQFVDWIAKIHHQPCHVVYTNYRPTPLQHYVFAAGGDGLHLVVDERGKFREANFQKAMAALQAGGSEGIANAAADAMATSGNAKGGGAAARKRKRGSHGGGPGGGGQNTDLHRIVKLVMERNLDPVIVFSFSKKDCEKYALELNREDYTDEIEKDLISSVYNNAIESLGEDDRKLPQVEALLPLLKKGIGIHHGGLLPILKEIVEILFSEGLIKCLFATETFSIGINMPAKTVVFTNTRKWDGKDFRWVTSGEYIQMSGRAGRRGKDDRGIVIQMMDEKMEPDVCKGILYGDPDPLNSSYKISYNMLLNMMRVEDVDPEYLLRASFHQFQQECEVPALEQKVKSLEAQANEIIIGSTEDEEKIGEYYNMNQQLLIAERKALKILRKSNYILPFIQQNGRMMKCTVDGENFGWGVLVSHRYKPGSRSAGSAGQMARATAGPELTLDVLLPCVDRHFDKEDGKDDDEAIANAGLLWRGTVRHCRPEKENLDDASIVTMRVFTIEPEDVIEMSAVRLFLPQDIQPEHARKNAAKSIREVQRRMSNNIPILDPIRDLKVKGDDFTKLEARKEALKERLASHSLVEEKTEETRKALLISYSKKAELMDQARAVANEARACKGMVKRDELKKMKRVLRQLGHVDANGVIQTKGRTACEINTANELIVVELVFSGIFNDLSVEQCVALLSCMTFDERLKSDDEDPASGLKGFLARPFYKLLETARMVAKSAIACKMEIDEDEFVNQFNPGLMEAVFAWCKGAKFVEVQKLTGTFEGTTIRCLRRLEELVRQLCSASKAIGNHELQTKFEKGSELIKRDIVFCSSLYL